MRRSRKPVVLEDILLTDYAAEGKALARVEGKVVFVSGAVPGDVADLLLIRNKKDWAEARVLRLKRPSPDRTEPFCVHFGSCGGCKWQMLPYEKQLFYKQQEAGENLRRIGKTEIPDLMPIVGSAATRHYRNKLEFTCSARSWRTREELESEAVREEQGAIGFHAPGVFDKAIDIHECHLMDPLNNRIRNELRRMAQAAGWGFYDAKSHQGWLRNLMIRLTTTGECMVNVVVSEERTEELEQLTSGLRAVCPEITSCYVTLNAKWNDSIYDLEPRCVYGSPYVTEVLDGFRFLISPKSFFQTNSAQAEQLYRIVRDFARLQGGETLYDLYCGTGSIGLFLSRTAGNIIGVETVAEAVADAEKNAALNGVTHARFFAGDVIDVCTDAFFAEQGAPDVVITDPPRAGMHEKLVQKLIAMRAPRIVYVSCNTATLARDIALLADTYQVMQVQPVDMFPHTQHIECVVRLELRQP